MTEKRPRSEPARPHPDPSIQEKGGYITPSTPAGQLPVVPTGPAPGSVPSAQTGSDSKK
ncbi:hypothetical protein Cph01nite_25010 [Cellulomonas phragmiteti]|uniref:Uncharacterized protein n=1 Tax=Cellulomonas phragmiteti TaxID=478780 RepID=A0ABQ4DN22_9CELL|nr:hypothetical protein Cph01nite_25010 [Cellulomonas phragmiteti]